MFSGPREEDPVGRGLFWLWSWGDGLEIPGVGPVAIGRLGASCGLGAPSRLPLAGGAGGVSLA